MPLGLGLGYWIALGKKIHLLTSLDLPLIGPAPPLRRFFQSPELGEGSKREEVSSHFPTPTLTWALTASESSNPGT